MATITSNASCDPSSISVAGKTSGSGTISWSLPTVPAGGIISSCKLTGTCTVSDASNKPATVTVNGTSVSSGVAFTVNLGTGNTTSSVAVAATGPHKNTNSTITFSNLVYTVTYAIYHTVTFVDWDGTVLKTQQVEEGTSATAPTDPIRTGYKFTGWDITFNNVTSDLTVTAQYEEALSFKVTIVKGIGQVIIRNQNDVTNTYCNFVKESNPTISEETNVSLPNGENFIFNFNGLNGYKLKRHYYRGSNGSGSDSNVMQSYMSSDQLISSGYNAVYVEFIEEGIVTYTVTFEDWNGTVLKKQVVEEGESATAPNNPTRDGYTFTGWDKTFDNITSNLTVTAQYSETKTKIELTEDWVNVVGVVAENLNVNDYIWEFYVLIDHTNYIELAISFDNENISNNEPKYILNHGSWSWRLVKENDNGVIELYSPNSGNIDYYTNITLPQTGRSTIYIKEYLAEAENPEENYPYDVVTELYDGNKNKIYELRETAYLNSDMYYDSWFAGNESGWYVVNKDVIIDYIKVVSLEEPEESNLVAKYTTNAAGVVPTFNDGYTYEVSETENNGIYTVEITSDTDFTSCSFNGKTNLLTIEYLKIANAVTSTYQMFYGCTSLTSINGMTDWDTSNVTTMEGMFRNCTNLTTIDVSNFNTTNVTTMRYMFANCESLTELDLSNFNTSSVTNMRNMFSYCDSLTSLNVSNFDTTNVTNMCMMFYNCNQLTQLNVSNFNTSNVTDMYSMFYVCQSLTSLDVSNFDTTNVTDMQSIFYGCNQLTSLDLSNFNTSSVTTMNSMLRNCTNLASISMNNSDYNSVNKVIEQLPTRTSDSMGTLRIVGIDDASQVDISTALSKYWIIRTELFKLNDKAVAALYIEDKRVMQIYLNGKPLL